MGHLLVVSKEIKRWNEQLTVCSERVAKLDASLLRIMLGVHIEEVR
jgi:hypothetical protein